MSKECRGCCVRYYPDELREHLLHCPVLTRDNRIAELEAELQNPSGGWYCTDCGSADALVSITFRIAELEAERDMAYASNRELRLLLREARHQGYAGHPTDWSLRVDAVLGPDKAPPLDPEEKAAIARIKGQVPDRRDFKHPEQFRCAHQPDCASERAHFILVINEQDARIAELEALLRRWRDEAFDLFDCEGLKIETERALGAENP